MSERGRVLGALLAGGASRRFGAPKWRAPFGGSSLGAAALATLSGATGPVVVVSGDPRTRELGHEVWPDVSPGRGPVAGIATALAGARRLGHDGAFVLACDLPLVTVALVRAVVALATDGAAVVPLGPDGPEPLCAYYPTAVLGPAEAALDADRRAARRLVEDLEVIWLPYADVLRVSGSSEPFLNVNTPADLRRAERARTRRTSPVAPFRP